MSSSDYSVATADKTILTWANPNGGNSQATFVNGALDDLVVPGSTGGNIVYSVNITDLTHLRNVISDIINYLTD